MKALAFITLCFIILACSKPAPEIRGAYKMLSQNVKADTIDQNFNNPQLKIYTDGYIMYANYNPMDSAASFGIGTYTLNPDGNVNESMIYSASDSVADDSTRNYTLAIERTDKGYKQVINGMGAQQFTLTEEYEAAAPGATSALDGAWVMTGGYNINAKGDTLAFPDGAVQYKTYYGGNFIYAHTWMDSLKVTHTGMGFGTFSMNGDNASKEIITDSNYGVTRGQTYDLVLTWEGSDKYSQTIKGETGSSTEVYKRLGK